MSETVKKEHHRQILHIPNCLQSRTKYLEQNEEIQ